MKRLAPAALQAAPLAAAGLAYRLLGPQPLVVPALALALAFNAYAYYRLQGRRPPAVWVVGVALAAYAVALEVLPKIAGDLAFLVLAAALAEAHPPPRARWEAAVGAGAVAAFAAALLIGVPGVVGFLVAAPLAEALAAWRSTQARNRLDAVDAASALSVAAALLAQPFYPGWGSWYALAAFAVKWLLGPGAGGWALAGDYALRTTLALLVLGAPGAGVVGLGG